MHALFRVIAVGGGVPKRIQIALRKINFTGSRKENRRGG